jgi:hypothetical protein
VVDGVDELVSVAAWHRGKVYALNMVGAGAVG